MTTKTTPPVQVHPADAPEQTNGLAITSLVLGILTFSGFLFLTGIPAIITGIMSLKKGQTERGMSIAGIVLGSIGTFFSLVLTLILALVIGLGIMSHSPMMQGETPSETMPVESSQT